MTLVTIHNCHPFTKDAIRECFRDCRQVCNTYLPMCVIPKYRLGCVSQWSPLNILPGQCAQLN